VFFLNAARRRLNTWLAPGSTRTSSRVSAGRRQCASPQLECLEDRVTPAALTAFIDPDPSPFDGFGTAVLVLGNGNVVITAPEDGAGGTDAGAVYLFDGNTGSRLSTLIGSHPFDLVGSGGVTALTQGFDYAVKSPNWERGVGAVTFGSGATGAGGTVSIANSLVGTTAGDYVGSGGVTALANGSYVVVSPDWNSPAATNVGAVTLAPAAGMAGAVSAANSLLGSAAASFVGSGGVVALQGASANFAVVSPDWGTSGAVNAGAVTWESGSAGVTGPVSPANSLVGPGSGCFVGSGGVTALSFPKAASGSGNYVVDSPACSNGSIVNAGAVTWGDGTNGICGAVTATNSLVGTSAGSLVGSGGVVALANVLPFVSGNYVIVSPVWSNGPLAGAGAVTWGSGTTGISGPVSGANSLVGTTAYSLVGAGGVTALSDGKTNNNYVVSSPEWGFGAAPALGAVTWGNGNGGNFGPLSAANSVVGASAYSLVGAGGVTALSNGDYVIKSPYWGTGPVADAGAVTWENGGAAAAGSVSAADSLVGTTAGSFVGSGGVTALGNSNYVVDSPDWNNVGALNAGAVTWENGGAAAAGDVSAANSLVGTTAGSFVGSGGVTALTGNGNPTLFDYVVDSPNWNTGSAVAAGAVTWGGVNGAAGYVTGNNSAIGTVGTVSPKITVTQDKFDDTFIVSFVNGADQVLVGSQASGFSPQVTDPAPVTGPAAGGTTVIISGVALADATAVDFGSTPATIVSDSADQIVVISPPGSPGAVPVIVSVPVVTPDGGTAVTVAAGQFTYVMAPTVTGLSAVAGPQSGSTTVTVSGSGLTDATAVHFGSASATIVSVSANQIMAVSPEGRAGKASVTVTTAGGTSVASTASQFTYMAPPAVTGIGPAAGLQGGGTTVTLSGNNLDNATAVDFGSVPATIISDTAARLVVTSPAGVSGSVAITVTNPGGTSVASEADRFSYCDPATSKVSVSSATVQAGNPVLLTLQTKDGSGNRLATGGLTAVFAVNNNSGVQATSGSLTYQGNGTYSAAFRETTADNYTVTVTINGQAVTSFVPAVVVTPGPVSLTMSSVAVSLASVRSGERAAVKLLAVDAYDNPETAANLPVTFMLGNGSGRGTFGQATSIGNGRYQATFTGTIAGNNTIGAILGGAGVTSKAPIRVTPGQYDLVKSLVTVSSSTVRVGGGITILLQTRDAAGNDLTTNLLPNGVNILFELGTLTSGGQGQFTSAVYVGNGEYEAEFTAKSVGINTIVALIDDQKVASRPPALNLIPAR
jgi:Repeat of unknown function (DUF5650)/IPT/TIG domain/FG-GAP repeat